ncbi:hypothetical protein KB206_17920 [Microvirga sp. STS02]|uniref:hypothetical protein n=1 Tax=Hymenobacter negativus TaxID=2795026 RepID=UPI0018DD058F|nr:MULTISPECIES: hypothetical protein [Bacteria]MBH8570776.1 hypothetical protein [Hymenobacter negativus]MBR7210513.1 hypothetical protein [Microvirga sp. STS02]
MPANEVVYTSLTASPENHQPDQPASLPQRCADWISYAVAVIQQAAPTAADFTQAEGRTM